MIVVEAGEVTDASDWNGEELAAPPGNARSDADRQALFDLAMWDRLRVLTTEVRRLVNSGREVQVRFDDETTLCAAELETALALI